MKRLHPDYFFNQIRFHHKELFHHSPLVWEALTQIEPYLKSQKLGKIEVDVPQGTFLVNAETISIGAGTILEPGAYIKGPCIIGKNCQIRHGAYIRGNLITGDDCVIGHDTEVKNCILLNGAKAGHFAYLGDSILGNEVNLGAGTKCANLKLDHGLISVYFDGETIGTGLRKFGAIIGDNTQTGCNSVTNPGTLLGQNVLCYPTINLGGFIPSGSLVKSETRLIIKTSNR